MTIATTDRISLAEYLTIDPDLSESQKRELERRIDAYKANPDGIMTRSEVKASIK